MCVMAKDARKPPIGFELNSEQAFTKECIFKITKMEMYKIQGFFYSQFGNLSSSVKYLERTHK